MSTPGYPYSTQQFVASGINTYTLSEPVPAAYAILVIVNGLVQLPNVDYEINGTDIVFNSVPNQGSDVEIRFFGPIDPGYRGSVGYTGSAGLQGITGVRGSVGYKGSVGQAGAALVFMAASPPVEQTEIYDGVLWWDTDNGILNIYYGNENTWVGIAEGPQGRMGYAGSQGDIGFTGSEGVGFTGSRGIQGVPGIEGPQGDQGPVGKTGFTGSRGYAGSEGAGYTGSSGLNVEDVVQLGSRSGNITADTTLGNVFELTPTGGFNLYFTNVSSRLTSNKTTTFVILTKQGGTPYIPALVFIDGTNYTVSWVSNTPPTGKANSIDAISFTVVKASSTYVLGQLISFG